MRILIIGGGGLFGTHLVSRLLAAGHEVAVDDNLASTKHPPGVGIYTANATDVSSMRHTIRSFAPEIIFVAPAHVFSREVIYNHLEDISLVTNSANVISSLLTREVKGIFFLSSSEVYGGPQTNKPLKESRTIDTSATHHGAAKLGAEGVLRLRCSELGIPCSVLRVFDMFGPRKFFCPRTGVVSFLIDSFSRGDTIGLVGAKRLRDFIHVEDVVDVCVKLMDADHDGIFNVGTGTGTTLVQLVKALATKMTIEHPPVLMPEGNIPTFSSVADISKLLSVLPKWKPTRNVITSLPALIEFSKEPTVSLPGVGRTVRGL